MSVSLFLQECPVCLVHLTWMDFRDGRLVAIQLLLCGVFVAGFVQSSL